LPGPLPGTVHDLAAARIWGTGRELAACGLVVPGDKEGCRYATRASGRTVGI
jgi:hypothetical protein